MSYRTINPECMLRGVVLASCHLLFPEGVPALVEFATKNQVASSTLQRAARWLVELLPSLLAQRRPGPSAGSPEAPSEREEAVKKLTDLYRWIQSNRSDTEKNACYDPEAKRRIAAMADNFQAAGTLSFEEIATTLEMNERQLRRIRQEVRSDATAPPPKSRKPHRTKDLADDIQVLIKKVQISGDSRDPYTAMDVKRILEKNYSESLVKHHGSAKISADTVRKYMNKEIDLDSKSKHHPRGGFVYPEPFQQVAIDTTHFKVFGFTFYLITILDVATRSNLVTRVFLRENTAAVVSTLKEYLQAFAGLGVVVIDRGTPYLNATVKNLLEQHGKLRLVCPTATPTAKAACERHFGTLKPVLLAALARIFPEKPGWKPELIAKVIEMGLAVFQTMYHEIPQEGIDGRSPAERAQEFDSFRAWSQMVDLLERTMRSEPAQELAGEIHDRFQLPGPRTTTIKRLQNFGGRVLRRTLEELRGKIGPPHPEWLYDALGYITVRAKSICEQEHMKYFRKQRGREERKQHQDQQREFRESRQEELDHPEQFVDETLEQAITFMDIGAPAGGQMRLRHLALLLESLASGMGRAFGAELERLHKKVDELARNAQTRRQLHAWLGALPMPSSRKEG